MTPMMLSCVGSLLYVKYIKRTLCGLSCTGCVKSITPTGVVKIAGYVFMIIYLTRLCLHAIIFIP
jgi:hypothetical protein